MPPRLNHENKGNKQVGPGSYNTTREFVSGKVNFTSGKRFAHIDTGVPSPVHYQGEPPKEGPKWEFGTGPNIEFKDMKVPGPGAYSIKSKAVEATKIKMTPRRELRSPYAGNPGPGAYKHTDKQTSKASPRAKIGTGPRMADYMDEKDKDTVPGPVSYQNRIPKETNSAIFIGVSKRVDEERLRTAPGPGSYNVSDRIKGPSFSMGSKVYATKPVKVPGPGEYNSPSMLSPKGAPRVRNGNQSRLPSADT